MKDKCIDWCLKIIYFTIQFIVMEWHVDINIIEFSKTIKKLNILISFWS